jgi:hypothetical protein
MLSVTCGVTWPVKGIGNRRGRATGSIVNAMEELKAARQHFYDRAVARSYEVVRLARAGLPPGAWWPVLPKPLVARLKEIVAAYEQDPAKAADECVFDLMGGQVNLTYKDVRKLAGPGSEWITDAIVNPFIWERWAAATRHGSCDTLIANSYFYACLEQKNLEKAHKAVNRRSADGGRSIDLLALRVFDYRRLLFPINVNNAHWLLCVVDLDERTVQLYDSLQGSGDPMPVAGGVIRDNVARYLQYREQKEQAAPGEGWTLTYADCPQQENGSDCGVFTCLAAERLLLDRPLVHAQADMNYCRQYIACTLLAAGKATHSRSADRQTPPSDGSPSVIIVDTEPAQPAARQAQPGDGQPIFMPTGEMVTTDNDPGTPAPKRARILRRILSDESL